MSFWEKAQNIDRRVPYTLLIVLIAYILIRPIGLAVEINAITQAAYNNLDKVPAGSIVWLSADYGASSMTELLPAQKAVMRHAFGKGLRVIAGGMWDEGGAMTDYAWQDVRKDFPEKKYGVDFVNVGYKPGGKVLLERIVADAHQALQGIDFYGKSFAELPLMSEFKTFKDAKLIFEFTSGTPGEQDYMKMVTDPLKIPFSAAATAVSVPGIMPFVQSGQMQGLLQGMSGSAQYEVLVKKPGPAVAGMDAQSVAHLLMVVFILIGNIGYLSTRGKKPQSQA